MPPPNCLASIIIIIFFHRRAAAKHAAAVFIAAAVALVFREYLADLANQSEHAFQISKRIFRLLLRRPLQVSIEAT